MQQWLKKKNLFSLSLETNIPVMKMKPSQNRADNGMWLDILTSIKSDKSWM